MREPDHGGGCSEDEALLVEDQRGEVTRIATVLASALCRFLQHVSTHRLAQSIGSARVVRRTANMLAVDLWPRTEVEGVLMYDAAASPMHTNVMKLVVGSGKYLWRYRCIGWPWT